MVPRLYQHNMVAKVRAQWAEGCRRVLGVLPTGGGKTEVASLVARDVASPTSRVLILTERKTLARQWVQRLHRHGLLDVGLIQAQNSRGLSCPTIVATAQSVRSQVLDLGGQLPDFGLIVIDEAHLWHKTYDAVLAAAPAARVLGLTATPLREGLGQRFDSLVVGGTIRDLMASGHLVQQVRYFAPHAEEIEAALAAVHIQAGDFATGELSSAMRNKVILGDVVGTWQQHGQNRQTIAFCTDKAHAHDLAGEFTSAGVTARVVLDDTDDEDRQEIFGAFDRGDLRVLCSVGVLSIGFDSPVASCAILARPTCSLSLFIQQGGRVLRPFDGKVDALVFDHAGNTLRFGLLEDFEPPADLSLMDKRSDKKPRHERAQVWTCRHCEAVNRYSEDACVVCGEPRVRVSKLVVVDGQLHRVELGANETPPGPTADDVREAHRMHLWHARRKGLQDGWAWHATLRRFRIEAAVAKRILPPPWERPDPVPPDEETARWVHADWQRQQVAWRKGRSAGSRHG